MSDALTEPDELPNQLSAVEQHVAQELRQRTINLWRSNYHEASIYIEEGLNNDKFENHPKKRIRKALATSPQAVTLDTNNGGALCSSATGSDRDKQPNKRKYLDEDQEKRHGFILGGQYTTIETYILVHNRYFYQLDLAASIVLLLLALFEPPAVDGYELNPKIHAAIEIFALGIIAIELLLKFRWMGPGRFFKHGRTVTKLIVLFAMNFEAIVIFMRHSTHARYSRALRPIFLIDNHYCHGLRRAVRQIFQSLPPIFDMFTLAAFFMFVFSIFGFYLFSSNNYYFRDMPSTIGNLLLLATTANLPDIMMPSYAISRWSALYFVLFVIIHLFLFTNLTMAAVYEIFTRREKEKFHKLLLHRRKACQQAFKLLVSRRQPNHIQYRQFMGLMRYLNRKCSMFDAYLIFKALDTDKSGSISLNEFYQIYDFINLDWKLIYPNFKWYDDYEWLPKIGKRVLSVIGRFCNHRLFDWIVDIIITGQAMLQFVEATAIGQTNADQTTMPMTMVANQSNNMTAIAATSGDDIYPDKKSTHIFISIFLVEALLRSLANGPLEYWRNRWNRFDMLVIGGALIGLLNGAFGGQPFGWVIVLRVLRLTRLFEFKRRYRDMWQTLTYILMKRFVSMTCVVMILYYFFAIIGMELLGDYDLRNCCKNTTLESQFSFDASVSTLDNRLVRYYLNDFGDLVASYLTLFCMSSSTYWLSLMSAYTIVSGSNWIRLFFGLYYFCSIIVMNIVIAFILESFLFHIQYRNKMGDNCDNTNLFTVSVTLSSFEVDFLRETLGSSSSTNGLNAASSATQNGHLCVKEMDKTVSKLRRANEQSKLLHTSTSSGSLSSGSSTYATKIISDDYVEDNIEQVNERSSLLRDTNNKANRKKKLSLAPKPAGLSLHDIHLGNGQGCSPLATADNTPMTGSIRSKQQRSTNQSSGFDHHVASPMLPANSPPINYNRRPEYYLIYQAEQIRNKFSFTMKMYADEVESWLAEAERADQDAMSVMISRNQLRSENVAMARLARRNWSKIYRSATGTVTDEVQTATGNLEDGGSPMGHGQLASRLLGEWMRPRSYSTSAGAFNSEDNEQAKKRPGDKGDNRS